MNTTVKKAKVALIACDNYDDGEVYRAVRAGLDLIGGISHFVNPGDKIVIKPNVLIGASPDNCVCTHPSVLRAVGKILLEAGASVTCGDSPAFGGSNLNMRISGLKRVADELGIKLADLPGAGR
jgi:uncharacterized protein (DUF362 family)